MCICLHIHRMPPEGYISTCKYCPKKESLEYHVHVTHSKNKDLRKKSKQRLDFFKILNITRASSMKRLPLIPISPHATPKSLHQGQPVSAGSCVFFWGNSMQT